MATPKLRLEDALPMVMAEANDATIFEQRYKYSVNQVDLADTESYGYLELLHTEGQVKSIGFVAEDTLHSTGALRGVPHRSDALRGGVVSPRGLAHARCAAP
jgi:hypothetical protein